MVSGTLSNIIHIVWLKNNQTKRGIQNIVKGQTTDYTRGRFRYLIESDRWNSWIIEHFTRHIPIEKYKPVQSYYTSTFQTSWVTFIWSDQESTFCVWTTFGFCSWTVTTSPWNTTQAINALNTIFLMLTLTINYL